MSKYYHPAYIGFDRLWKLLDEIDQSHSTNAYPPHNLVSLGDNKYLLEMAVAGFTHNDLSVVQQENVLTVSGKSPETLASRSFVHRGIAGRSFTKSFTLADTIEVLEVNLSDGMLRVTLENVIPEAKKPRNIAINTGIPQLLVEKSIDLPKNALEKDTSLSAAKG